MMFQSGRQDKLFPLAAINEAYAKMREVWESRQAGDKLETRIYDVPHLFNRQMQDDAFDWLDQQFKTSASHNQK